MASLQSVRDTKVDMVEEWWRMATDTLKKTVVERFCCSEFGSRERRVDGFGTGLGVPQISHRRRKRICYILGRSVALILRELPRATLEVAYAGHISHPPLELCTVDNVTMTKDMRMVL